MTGRTLACLVLEQIRGTRSRREAPQWYFGAAISKICQIAIILLVAPASYQPQSPDLHAQARPPQAQNAAQKDDTGLQSAPSPELLVVPDGTALTLKFEKELSSSMAKAGDTVEFTVAYHLRLNGVVIVPKGTPVSGSVVAVKSRGLAGKNGEVKFELRKLTLPTGESVSLRIALGSGVTARRVGEKAAQTIVPMANPFLWPMLPVALLAKGEEKFYPAGSWTTVFLDGELTLNPGSLAKLQPLPYKGPAQVFVKNRKRQFVGLYSGQDFVGWLYQAARVELKPGNYSLSTSKSNEHAIQLEVQEDHQYWVEHQKGGLVLGDPQQHRDELDQLESAPWLTDRNFAAETPTYKGPAQITFVNRAHFGKLFCGRKQLDYLGAPLRMEVIPGTYSFSTGKAKEKAVRLQVQDDHQYWIERRSGGLFVSDFQRLHDDVEHVVSMLRDIDLTSQAKRNVCVPEALP